MARINEIGDTEKGQYMLGRLRARKFKREGFQKGNEIGKYAEKAREKATQKNKNVDGVDHIVYSPDKYNRLTNSHANGWHDEMRKDENRNMKQQLKLNESELHNLIEGAVKQLVMEYLPYEGGKVAARRLQQGDTSAFEKYMNYGLNNGWTNDDMNDFQSGIETGPSVIENGNDYDEDFEDLNDSPINNAVDGSLEDDIAFEEGRRAVKVNESQLFNIIKESVNILLKEAFKSPKLNAMAKQHGGIAKWYKNYGTDIPFSDLTDDMIDDNVTKYDPYSKNGSIQFGDGTGIGLTRDGKNYSKNWYSKEIDGTYDNPLINQNRYYPTTERGKMANSVRRCLGQSMRDLNNPQKQDPQTQQRIQGRIKDMRNHTNQMYNNKGMYK